MKLFLLERTVKGKNACPQYDINTGFVVRAKNEQEAREIVHNEGGSGDERRIPDFWLDPTLSSCTPILLKGEAEVILRSFEAG